MKKIITVLTIALLSITTAYSQDLSDLDTLEDQFATMSEDIGSAIGLSATSGLTWSDSYIGNFPHLGIGIFTGVEVVPIDAFEDVLSYIDPDASLPSGIDIGLPIPSAGVEARIGGFVIPFDIGVKAAVLSDLELAGVSFDYSLLGADVRYAVLKGNAILPKISVGAGYSRLTTNIGIEGILDGDYEIFNGGTNATTFYLSNPDLVYDWESNVIEFKGQVSKTLFVITPYLNVNASYAMTTVTSALETTVIDGNGSDVDQSSIDAVSSLTSIDTDGFETSTEVDTWSTKITLGSSFNIFLAKFDLSAYYEIMSESYGGTLSFRVQL